MRAAIAARDPATARAALRRDIDDAAVMLRRVLSEEAVPAPRARRKGVAMGTV